MEGSSDSSSTRHVPIPPFGLSIIVDTPNPLYDIIFVHGLNGHLERTWTAKSAEIINRGDRRNKNEHNEIHVKLSKWNGIWRGRNKDPIRQEVPVFWPRDLTPMVAPEARILAYGYDSKIRPPTGPPASTLSIYQISNDFLVAIEAARRDEPERPIIFVAHSLGGIVVKEALRQSSSIAKAQFRSVFESTSGMIFFGTPHYGANPRESLRRFAMAVAKAMNYSFNEQIINSLLPSSERLQELADTFGPMSRDRQWVIHSFQEQYGVQSLGDEKVVEDSSSKLNLPELETVEHIGRDHHKMCRFTGVDDPEFKKVKAALRRVITAISEKKAKANRIIDPDLYEETETVLMTATQEKKVKSNRLIDPDLYEEQKQLLFQSLRFEQLDARQITIKNAHFKTCKWIVEKDEFLDWLDDTKFESSRGFLWMKGNPGTGKSTLMKFIVGHVKKKLKDKAIISFFFNARGGALEKSTIGLYRSLLVQIFTQFPKRKKVLHSLLPLPKDCGREYQWAVEPLKEFLRDAILGLKEMTIMCFIDALDECNEIEVRDMISFFQSFSQQETNDSQPNFRVFFSSRHYPHITINFGLNICLENQEGHYQDITRYVATELRIGESKLADEVRTELHQKASGIFIWVVLVVGILNKEYDRGNIHTLRQRLRDIPGDLHMLFQQIFRRDNENPSQHLLCIQWILFAKTPLTPRQLYFAIRSGLESEVMSEWEPEKISKETTERFILDSSKGVAEVTKSDNPTVQFIHESVREFLLKEDGFKAIWPEFDGDFEGRAHEAIKKSCLSYNRANISTSRDPHYDSLRESVVAKFPLLDYSLPMIFYHADMAEKKGIPQKNFLRALDRKAWIAKRNVLQASKASQYTSNASLLYILAESNTPHLIQNYFEATACLAVEGERYGCPLIAAIATRSTKARATFHKQLSTIYPTELCKENYSDGIIPFGKSAENLFTRLHYTVDQRRSMLSTLAEAGNVFLVSCFLSASNANAGIPDLDTGRTPLSIAAKDGHYAMVAYLLEQAEVTPDFADKTGRTPLSWAASNGHKEIMELLMTTMKANEASCGYQTRNILIHSYRQRDTASITEPLVTYGVEVDSMDHSGRTPLSYASEYGSESIVRVLLDTGKVDPDSRGVCLRTPLSYAAEYGHEAIVRLLLATGKVDPDSRDSDNLTPLSHLSARSHPTGPYEAVIRLLLETGKVDPNAKGKDGETPVSRALRRGNVNITNLLIGARKV